MLKRISPDVVDRIAERYLRPKPIAQPQMTEAEREIRRAFRQLIALRKTGQPWEKILLRVFGPEEKRPRGLSFRNAYRLLKQVADEKGVTVPRIIL